MVFRISSNKNYDPQDVLFDTIEIESVIDAYRAFYFFEKNHFLSWKGKIAGRDEPQWITVIRDLFE